MDRNKTIELLKKAVSLTRKLENNPFTINDYCAMNDLLCELKKEEYKQENKPEQRRNYDDWKGCQGTCDFEEIPNMTGWI